MEDRPDFLDVGKLAIAYCLIPFEDESRLYKPDPLRGGDWYRYLWGKLNSRFEEFGNNKLKIITFNYDRSLEHYLLNALHYSHNRKFDECATALAAIPIIHIYGQLSTCSYSSYPLQGYNQYRPDPDRLANVGAASGITLLHEEAQVQAGRDALTGATRVCFLGFGYHPLNIARLNIDPRFDLRTTVIGTSRGLIGAEVPSAKSRLLSAIGGDIAFCDADNLDILRRNMFLD